MTVYFADRRKDRAIKIGYTGAEGDRAKKYIRARAAGAVELARTEGGRVVEGWFHRRHASGRLYQGTETEWFVRTPALMADVVMLATGGRRVQP